MSLIEDLYSKGTLFTLKYYGLNDGGSSYILGNIIKHKETITDYYQNTFDIELPNFNSFLDYIFLENILKFKEFEPNLKDEFKEDFSIFLDQLSIVKKQVKIISLINSLKLNFDYIFSQYSHQLFKHDLQIAYLELALQYFNVLKNTDIFKNLSVIEPILFYDIFNRVKNLLSKKELMNYFLDNENLEQILKYRSDNFMKFILPILDKSLKIQVLDKIISIYSKKITYFSQTKDTIAGWKLLVDLNLLYPVFFSEKHDKCKFLLDEKSKLDIFLKESLTKSGKAIKIEASSEQYYNLLKTLNDPLLKFLTLSHLFYVKERTFKGKSKLQSVSQRYKSSLCDYGSTNIPTDDFFTLGKIFTIENLIIKETTNLNVWLSDEYQEMFISNIENIIKNIYTNLSINFSIEEMDNDINALKNCINNLTSNCSNFIYFSASFFISAFLEKILRNIYIKMDDSNFFNHESATLNVILKNNKIESILGNDAAKWLRYYLTGDTNKIGKNYRNKLAHFKIDIGSISHFDSLVILWLFVITINSFYTFINKKEE